LAQWYLKNRSKDILEDLMGVPLPKERTRGARGSPYGASGVGIQFFFLQKFCFPHIFLVSLFGFSILMFSAVFFLWQTALPHNICMENKRGHRLKYTFHEGNIWQHVNECD
jgi:hypothetical protein